MNITVVIHTAPWSHQASATALRFCEAALQAGHGIYRLFFYYDGVHNTSTLAVPAQDELDIPAAWRALIEQHGIDTVSCVSSALKRGILNDQEARRYEREASNLAATAELSGLGQLIEATAHSDRVVNFGA
ncbi:MAG: sulfurtransferase complex subunit TusD [Pseudohongiellaceae bacterium]